MSESELVEDTSAEPTEVTIHGLLDSIRRIGYLEGRSALRQDIMDCVNSNNIPENTNAFNLILECLLVSIGKEESSGEG